MNHIKIAEEVFKKSSKERVILRKSKFWPKMAHHTRINRKPWVIILFTAVNQQCFSDLSVKHTYNSSWKPKICVCIAQMCKIYVSLTYDFH